MPEISRSRQVSNLGSEIVSVRDFGAIGDGVTDDTAAVQAALTAAKDKELFIPTGTYMCEALSWPRGTHIIGEHPDYSILKLKDNANTFLIASAVYIDNDTFSHSRPAATNVQFNGNKANNTSGSAVIIRSFRGRFQNVRFADASDYGCLLSQETANGTDLSNSIPENTWSDCSFEDNEKHGLYARIKSGGLEKIADGVIDKCEFNTNGDRNGAAIYIERGAGWKILNNQIYNGGFHNIYMDKISRCVVSGNHLDLGATAATSTDRPACIWIEGFSSHGGDIITDNICNIAYDNSSDSVLPTCIAINAGQASGKSMVITDNTGFVLSPGAADFYFFNGELPNTTINNQIGNCSIGAQPSTVQANWSGNEIATFMPTVTFATVGDFSPTYNTRNGDYSRIGNMVFFQIELDFDTNAYTTASGQFRVGNLPYSASGDFSFYACPVNYGPANNVTLSDTSAGTAAHVVNNQNYMEFRQNRAGASSHATFSTGAIVASKSNIVLHLSGWYPAKV